MNAKLAVGVYDDVIANVDDETYDAVMETLADKEFNVKLAVGAYDALIA